MHKTGLILAYKAMLYVAREEGEEIDEKHLELENELLNAYELSVTDMIDNLDVFYNEIVK